MKLQTNRLALLPLSLSDLGLFHQVNTDKFVRRYLWDDEAITIDTAREILEEVESLFREERYGLWKMVKAEGETFIGYAGLWRFFDERQPQLLYALYQHETGMGYASEAAGGIINYAFDTLGFEYLIASMDVENLSSIKLCENMGFSFLRETSIDDALTRFYRLEKPA